MTTNWAAKEAIHGARTKLLVKHPFYGFLAQRFKLREVGEDSDMQMPTMATDSVHLYYNPEFVLKCTTPQLLTAIAHEVEHTYLEHIPRMMKLVPEPEKASDKWTLAQVAADMAINPHLKDGGFEFIDGAVFPEKEFWDDSFEPHYRRLLKSAKQKHKCGGGCSGVQPLKDKNGEPMPMSEVQQLVQELQVSITNAANFARAAGKLPGYIERMLQQLQAPKVSWKDVLRRFMQALAKQDYRMMPPNRRYVHQSLYLPSLHSETVGTVALYLDGSGSTFDAFPQFISEFASILLDVRPEKLIVLCWDTRCTWKKEFSEFSDTTASELAAMQTEMGAGGGTVFTDCFNYLKSENESQPQVAIVLTDMELFGGWPEEPEYPVIWVATTDIVGPYGETARIEV